jgi:hypothetical protein
MDSMCSFNGKILCASTSGIFEHSGTSDSGSVINAYFRLASMNFDSARQKRFRKLYIGGYIAGEIKVTVITDEDTETIYYVGSVAADNVMLDIPLNFEDKGEFVSVEIGNVNGADFSIDEMSLVIALIVLQPKTSQIIGRVKQSFPVVTGSASGS